MTDPVSFWPADFAGWTEAVRNAGLVLAGAAGFGVALWALLLNRRRTANDTKRLDNEAVRLESDRQRLVNDTYVKAIEQLGHAKMEVRLGAIYALERIAATDRDYHWPIMETLCAYIRERPASKWGEEIVKEAGAYGGSDQAEPKADSPPARDATGNEEGKPTLKRPPTDIQAILTVFERRSEERRAWEEAKELRLDLRHADLRGAVLSEVRLQRVDLTGGDLTGANLWRADLTGADLMLANLTRAVLGATNLTGADLMGATLMLANLWQANLTRAKLGEADLTRAQLWTAGLMNADLSWANLTGSNLKGVDLTGADLTGTRLTGAKFSKHPSELGALWNEAFPPRNLDKIEIEEP